MRAPPSVAAITKVSSDEYAVGSTCIVPLTNDAAVDASTTPRPAPAASAADEFAALGLGKQAMPYGTKQPPYGQPPYGQSGFAPPGAPSYVSAMRALPAAGSRTQAAAPFRLG